VTHARISPQYKGTDLCADFRCGCGFVSHIDAHNAYGVRCTQCGTIYAMPQDIQLVGVLKNAPLPPVVLNIWDEDDDEAFDPAFSRYTGE
jgi:hypothetical protein